MIKYCFPNFSLLASTDETQNIASEIINVVEKCDHCLLEKDQSAQLDTIILLATIRHYDSP